MYDAKGTIRVRQRNKTFGPYDVNFDFDLDGISPVVPQETINDICAIVKHSGAESGYADMVVYDGNGWKIEDLCEHIII